MQTINPLASLRALKGAPLSCLFALMFSNQPVGKEWLSGVTGYSDKPVAKALNYLLEMGYVTANGRYDAWQINKSSAVQLPLMNLSLGETGSRIFSDSLPTTSSTTIGRKEDQPMIAAAEEQPSRNFSDSHKILRAAGVGEPMATKLAQLDHCTPYYIAAHIIQAKKEETPVGLLIHRIRSNDPAPDLNQKYHILSCSCFECLHFIYQPDHGHLPPEDFNPHTFLESQT